MRRDKNCKAMRLVAWLFTLLALFFHIYWSSAIFRQKMPTTLYTL